MPILKKKTTNNGDLYPLIIANVITPLDLDSEDQEYVKSELKWLFTAADNLQKISGAVQQQLEEQEAILRQRFVSDILYRKKLDEEMVKISPKICRTVIERSQPVQVSIPIDAERLPEANNQLLTNPKSLIFYADFADMLEQLTNRDLKSQFARIDTHLRNLNILLNSEVNQGEEGKRNVALQYQIRAERINIVKILQEMAKLIDKLYGIFVASPEQLVEYLA